MLPHQIAVVLYSIKTCRNPWEGHGKCEAECELQCLDDSRAVVEIFIKSVEGQKEGASKGGQDKRRGERKEEQRGRRGEEVGGKSGRERAGGRRNKRERGREHEENQARRPGGGRPIGN